MGAKPYLILIIICRKTEATKKHLLTLFIYAFLFPRIICLPLYGHIFGLNNLPALSFHSAIGGLGPLITSFFTNSIFLKKEGSKRHQRML